MTAYGIQAPAHAGLTLTMTAPSGTAGDTTPTGDRYGLLVQNQNPGSLTVTLPVVATYDGLAVTSRTVSIPGTTATASAQGGWELIPIPSAVYGTAAESVIYSTAGSVNVAALRIP